MTGSLQILDIVKENAVLTAIAVDSVNVPLTFATAEPYEINAQFDDATINLTFPILILDRPLFESLKIVSPNGGGGFYKTGTFDVFIFTGRKPTTEIMSEKESCLLSAKEYARQFILRLMNDSRVLRVGEYTCEEVPENLRYNANPIGIHLNIRMTVQDTLSQCLINPA